jgi:hypothetical protein
MKTTPTIGDTDAFYEALMNAHDGLDDDQSAALNARLILLLANQVGDDAVLMACLKEAAKTDAAKAAKK